MFVCYHIYILVIIIIIIIIIIITISIITLYNGEYILISWRGREGKKKAFCTL